MSPPRRRCVVLLWAAQQLTASHCARAGLVGVAVGQTLRNCRNTLDNGASNACKGLLTRHARPVRRGLGNEAPEFASSTTLKTSDGAPPVSAENRPCRRRCSKALCPEDALAVEAATTKTATYTETKRQCQNVAGQREPTQRKWIRWRATQAAHAQQNRSKRVRGMLARVSAPLDNRAAGACVPKPQA